MIVHRIGIYRGVHRALCYSSPSHTPTTLTCSTDTHREIHHYLPNHAVVDCMTCLVVEARKSR